MNEDIHPISNREPISRIAGLVAGPVAALVVYLALGSSDGLTEEARRLAAVIALMALWWVFESIPLAATALVPVVCFPVLDILPIAQTTERYADKLIFLFMGGLMLGAGLERWGAHKRIALSILLLVGNSPKQIVAGVMISAAILSAFVSNTATAMMMLPIVGSISLMACGTDTNERSATRFHVCLLLALAYGCSIGGIATLTGTPPNGLLASFLTSEMGIEMSYARWLRIGIPMTCVMLPISWVYLVYIAMPVRIDSVPGGRQAIRQQRRVLGPSQGPERTSILIFALTAFLWITHGWIEDAFGLVHIDDSAIAILGALLMFIIPADRKCTTRILSWKQAQDIPWGILILFGGGLALAQGVMTSGLDVWIGSQIATLGNPGQLPMLGGVTTLIVFMTEITSNTATTSTMLPVLAAVSNGMGIDATMIVIAAAISASCAFMLPVATPPNAIVFASGRITIKQMAIVGFGLNLICIVVVTLMVWGIAPWALGIGR